MKKVLFVLTVLLITNVSLRAQYVAIPDDQLRSQLIYAFPSCFNAAEMLDTTCSSLVYATSFSINDAPLIMNWDGYQYLKNLRYASIQGSIDPPQSAIFPIFPATLKELHISSMPYIASPVILPDSLERLVCSYRVGAQYTSFPATLRYIYFNYTYCSYLPPLPAALDTLNMYYNEVAVLPPLPASLKYLECGRNYLTSLPPFPASSSLKYFGCSENVITELPVLPDSLETLDASLNNLSTISNFPASLKTADLGGNYLLASVPALPKGLKLLQLIDTQVDCVPPVPDSTNGLEIRVDDNISCVANHPLPSYYLSFFVYAGVGGVFIGNASDSFPLCNPVNNSYGCRSFPEIIGHAYNDYNDNGVRDPNEPYRANVKVQLSNGVFTMTNSNGYYEISTDNIGSYSLTITPPDYFTSAPLQYNFNFNTYDTIVSRDFALKPTGTVDAISVSILPVNAAARPGFVYPYVVSYANVGTTTLTPNIVLNYDNSRLTYDSSSNPVVINSGSSLTLAESAMPFGQQKQFTGYFKVKPTAVIGDSIKARVSIQASAVTASDSTAVRIRGSFDPNDKSATPSLSTSQVANGDYIYYTIRFQNTGTDSAFLVVISDSLNSQLQPSSLQVINTSHPAKITVNGNVVYFEFLNIRLPDSNVNPLKSHGFVTFRVKPQQSVAIPTIISNKAAIYFDYNTPVITPQAQTFIYNPGTLSHTFTFNGAGNWTNAANWAGGVVPPSNLQINDHVIINGSCILDILVSAASGSSIFVVTGKSFLVQGNLTIQ